MSSPTVTFIIPTYNEVHSVAKIIPPIHSAGFSVIVVDDNSTDGTIDAVCLLNLPNVDLVVRKGERGLGGAIREGSRRAKTPYVAVMDSDGQHRIEDVMKTVNTILNNPSLDLCSGSRFLEDGGVEGLSGWRLACSRGLNRMANLRAKTFSTDYLTGMFCCRTELVRNTTEVGFKILFDILKHNKLKASEVPIVLTYRDGGKSKAGVRELWRFMKAVLL